MSRSLFPTTERIVVELENTGENQSINLDKPDDVLLSHKRKMGDYLSITTKASRNKYFILPGEPQEERLTDDNNNPVSIQTVVNDGTTNSTQLQDLKDPNAVNSFLKTSNSGQLDLNGDPLVLKKGKSSLAGLEINDIYSDVNVNGEQSSFVKRVQQVLKENNLNTSDNPHVSGDVKKRENDSNISITRVQRTLGEHGPRKFPYVVQGSKKEDLVTIQELKKVGLLTMLEASGELAIPSDPTGVEFISSLLPGQARLGLKVPVSRFSAVNAYKKANPSFEKPSSTSFIENDNLLSYGNVNNYAATFSGITSGPSIVTASLLSLTIGGLLKLLALALRGSSSPMPQAGGTPVARAKRLGSFVPKDSDPSLLTSIGLKFDLLDTRHDYMSCVSKGLDVFFGVDSQDTFLSTVGNGAKNMVKLHGYYNVILRSLVRSASSFIFPGIDAATTLGSNNSTSTEQETAVTDLALAYNPVSLLEKINNSPMLKFLNIVASIGDTALSTEQFDSRILEDGLSSIIDLIEENDINGGDGVNPAIIQAKHRLSDGKLAWRQTSVKSLYILPESLRSARERFNSNSSIYGELAGEHVSPNDINNKGNSVVVSNPMDINNGKRIKQEIVEKMEDYLERDYMPFYFHDLRTNEIISFHAFLDNVTDGFDAEYSETEGFGRVDKVQIYKSTNRSISLSFKLVSIDEVDFDEMWHKINKLVTLVYPQWSKGREIKWGNNRMVQPFSQYPAASPLVRMRLGDLFKSNYSKFALARLFGISMDSSEFNLERTTDNQQNTTLNTQQRIRDKMVNITSQRESNIYAQGDVLWVKANSTGNLHQDGYRRVNPIFSTPISVPAVNSRRNGNTTRDHGVILHYPARAIVVEATTSTTERFKVSLMSPGDGQNGDFFVSPADTYIDRTNVERVARQRILGTTEETTSDTTSLRAIQSFLSETENPIFKAFASTKGRGMAGFIKSLHFDFNETTWQTDKFNGRAPNMLKIDMEFSPIHDIAPGIDHNGFMTAPTYNVGNKMGSLAHDENPETRMVAFQRSRDKMGSYANNRNSGVLR